MDPARKKELKKTGKRLVEEESAKSRAKVAAIDWDEELKNYRTERLKRKEKI